MVTVHRKLMSFEISRVSDFGLRRDVWAEQLEAAVPERRPIRAAAP
jgi:hypothetical protein